MKSLLSDNLKCGTCEFYWNRWYCPAAKYFSKDATKKSIDYSQDERCFMCTEYEKLKALHQSMISVEQMSNCFDINKNEIIKMIEAGDLPAIKIKNASSGRFAKYKILPQHINPALERYAEYQAKVRKGQVRVTNDQ